MVEAQREQARQTRVLIADSYSAVREGLAALLSSQDDFEVVGEADNTAEALRKALALRPDLLLLDLEMSPLDGETALMRLRGAGLTTTVVALSMSNDTNRRKALVDTCCQGYIQKGVRPEDVLRTIRAALRTRSTEPHVQGSTSSPP